MSKKVLLVEDEALIAMNEAWMPKKHGYEVVTAHNGEKAVEAVSKDPEISIVLIDMDLGKGMDGTEAARIICEQHDLPIVFLFCAIGGKQKTSTVAVPRRHLRHLHHHRRRGTSVCENT